MFASGWQLLTELATCCTRNTLVQQGTAEIVSQTDTQQFCYDSLNRMTWSGTSGTPPCSGVNFAAGTLTAAQYQQSDSYTVDGGLTTGPSGSSTYGNSSHPHALMSTSGGYSAAYDATGNLVCRAPTSSTTCSGPQTGQQLSYDAEGRLTNWQNQPSAPTSTVNYLYDGSGTRVAMQATVGGTTTTTAYIGSIEEVQTTGSTTQTTTYYMVGGKRIAAKVNSTFYYFGYVALGSQVVVLNNNGTVVGSQLYGPYGNQRYSNGILPTSIGFTGQRADSITGLDYYGARYYDPVAGVFLSPDSVQGNALGFDPYAYVTGNPETMTDQTGHSEENPEDSGGDFGDGGDPPGAGGDTGTDTSNNTDTGSNTVDEPSQAQIEASDAAQAQEAADVQAEMKDAHLRLEEQRAQAAAEVQAQAEVQAEAGPPTTTVDPPAQAAGAAGSSSVPPEANTVRDFAKDHNNGTDKGYKGNKPWANDGREGAQVLDKTTSGGESINYWEYDIHPNQAGVDRGGDRILRGSDGRWLYTANHYRYIIEF